MQRSLFDLPMADAPERIGAASVRAIDSLHLLNAGTGSVSAFDYTLNPYRGCSFGCSYCYAPFFEPDEIKRTTWGTWVEVKHRAIEALTRVDLRGKLMLMSSVTDPYQPLEAKLRLTRSIVEFLKTSGVRLVVQTRSPIVERDLDLLREFEHVWVNLSVPTDDDAVRRRYEPNCASIERRLETLRRVKEAGLPATACISPMIPMTDPAGFGRKLTDIGVDRVVAVWFHKSERAFSSNTRELALELNKQYGWTEERFKAAKQLLKENCPAAGEGRRSFLAA